MRKYSLLLFLFFIAFYLPGEPLDIIVMIDTSSSMEPYFDNLVNYLFINTLSNNMYLGDRFHLLCFSSYPSIELAETLKNEDSIRYMQKEINFLKGRLIFGRYTDLLAALELVINYAENPGVGSNKRILLLSDGIHDPPPDSPYAHIPVEAARAEVEKYVQTIIDKKGWSIRILRMPEKYIPGTDQQDSRATGKPASVFNSDYFQNNDNIISEMDNSTARPLFPTGRDSTDTTLTYPAEIKPGTTRRAGQTGIIPGVTQLPVRTGIRPGTTPWTGLPGNKLPVTSEQQFAVENTDNTPQRQITGKGTGGNREAGLTPEPEQSSSYTGLPGATPRLSGAINLFDDLKDKINVDIIDFEQNNNQELPNVSIGFPRLHFPGNLGKKEKEFTIPFVIQSFQDTLITIQLNRLEDDKGTILTQKKKSVNIKPHASGNFKVKIRVPDYIPYGPCALPVHLFFDDDHRISPRAGSISFTYVPPLAARLSTFITDNLLMGLFILLGIILLLFIFFMIRRISSSMSFSNYFKPTPWMKNRNFPFKDIKNLIEMRVSMQNHNIGFRNIHKIEDNMSFAIGGGRSPYLIFLVSIPANIGVITRKNGDFVFIPKKMDFFPDLTDPLHDCLNKNIKIVSSKGYEMTITFIHYISPLEEINKLLHCINNIV